MANIAYKQFIFETYLGQNGCGRCGQTPAGGTKELSLREYSGNTTVEAIRDGIPKGKWWEHVWESLTTKEEKYVLWCPECVRRENEIVAEEIVNRSLLPAPSEATSYKVLVLREALRRVWDEAELGVELAVVVQNALKETR